MIKIEILRDVSAEVGLLFTLGNSEGFAIVDISDDVRVIREKDVDPALRKISVL